MENPVVNVEENPDYVQLRVRVVRVVMMGHGDMDTREEFPDDGFDEMSVHGEEDDEEYYEEDYDDEDSILDMSSLSLDEGFWEANESDSEFDFVFESDSESEPGI
uniref:Uncharacterized protein n=1 Tax=Bracon brevicornis TaxID=1563983 RepID=A0A6V7JHK8_9HYME